MTTRQATSFAHASLLEAVARRTRVDLVIGPATRGGASRLISRFLLQDGDRLVLEVPEANGKKVYVSAGSRMGMAFTVGSFFLQAPTIAAGICQYPLSGTRRVEVLLAEMPARIVTANRRQSPRYQIDPHVFVFVSAWPACGADAGAPASVRTGRVLNFSQTGLGIRLDSPLACDVGTELVVRLEQARAKEYPIYRAVLRHQTRDPEGFWLAGLSDVAPLEPGASPLIETIARAHP